MKIKLTCLCGASLEVDENFLKGTGLKCPNCGQIYPQKIIEGTQSMLKGYQDLCEAFAEEDCRHYEIEL